MFYGSVTQSRKVYTKTQRVFLASFGSFFVPVRETSFYPHKTDPPFTLSTSPVMWLAQVLHRKTIGPAISSGVATRPSGMILLIASCVALSASASVVISVSTQPGATQLTLIPKPPNSGASDFVNEICPPFDAA